MNNEIYNEVLEIYDDNTRAIALHISFLSSKSKINNKKSCIKNNVNIEKIEKELNEYKNIDEYRRYFLDILEGTNKDIYMFKDLSEFRINGLSDVFFNLNNILKNEKDARKNIDLIKKFKEDCLDINIQTKSILEILK